MKLTLNIFFLSLIFICVAQKKVDTVYLGEKDNFISKMEYKNKINSPLYYALIYDLDTVVCKKARLSYFFGKIELIKKQQLFKLLSKRNNIDTTQVLVFHYIDTLKNKNQFPEKDLIQNLNNGKHKHIISYKTFIRQHKECLRKYKNTKVLHYYDVNSDHPERVGRVVWYKDPSSVIRKIFRDSYRRFNFFIVKPNGEYYVHNINDGEEINIKKMIRSKWDYHASDFKKRYNSLNGN